MNQIKDLEKLSTRPNSLFSTQKEMDKNTDRQDLFSLYSSFVPGDHSILWELMFFWKITDGHFVDSLLPWIRGLVIPGPGALDHREETINLSSSHFLTAKSSMLSSGHMISLPKNARTLDVNDDQRNQAAMGFKMKLLSDGLDDLDERVKTQDYQS